jgi:multidrug efflux system membrane fusion protein
MPMPLEENNTYTETQRVKRSRSRWWLLILAVALFAAGWYVLSGRGGTPAAKRGAKPAMPPSPVLALPARKGDVGVYLNALGSVTPTNTVTVKSRIDGQLMELRFREGQMVKRGDLLAVIDPRPFQVQLTQAEGQMARDAELLRNARVDLARYRQLWSQDSIPKQQLDTQESLVRQYEGLVKIDQGQIDAARLQLVYSRITAPVSGRVGLKQVDPGNIVHASDANGLVLLTELQPAGVVFPIPEDSLPPVMARMRSGARLQVEAFDREQKQRLAVGTLETVDNLIDANTGTVKLKATFPNRNNELFPNQFVNARLLLETKRQAVLVASSAVQRGPQGTFVYLVKPDRTVTVRPITVGVVQGDDTSIAAGLAEGELVVVDGAERLREGSKVDLKEPGKNGNGRGRGGQGAAGQGAAGQAGGAQGAGGQGQRSYGQGRPAAGQSTDAQGARPGR